jgi:hypothetical protein
LPAEKMPGQSPTNSGLPSFAQKILLQEIERNGDIDQYRNKDNKKEQLLRPLLEKFPNLFGGRGDTRLTQASDCVKYWYNNLYRKDTYKELLLEFDITCCLDSANILPTPPVAPSGKILPTSPFPCPTTPATTTTSNTK